MEKRIVEVTLGNRNKREIVEMIKTNMTERATSKCCDAGRGNI